MMKKALTLKSVLIVAVLLAIAAGVVVFLRPAPTRTPDGPEPGTTLSTHEPGAPRIGEAEPGAARVRRRASAKAPRPQLDLDDDDMSPQDRALANKIEQALDDEDLQLALSTAGTALNSKNAEIRQAMVETLGWFGVKALPELTPFLADADDDVSESAMSEWTMALSEIEDDAERIGVVELAMGILSDEDALEEISGEYIGIDEKIAVESLLRIIEGASSPDGIAKAKETYEFVTGETFTTRADAEEWLATEYRPPEEDPSAEDGAPEGEEGDAQDAEDEA